jgi:hypothetical protein
MFGRFGAATVLLQIFWISYIGIGYTFFRLLRHLKFRGKLLVPQLAIVNSMHLLSVSLILFVLGVAGFIVPMVLAYSFEWPVMAMAGIYVVAIIATAIVIAHDRHRLLGVFRSHWHSLTREQRLLGCLVAGLLLVEYLFNLKLGVSVGDDTPLHLSKIQLFLTTHMTFKDPFVGYNGILDLRYGANVLNGLQAVAGRLLGQSAYNIWFYSAAFYKLLLQVALFVLMWTFLPTQRQVRRWAYLVALLVPYFASNYFFTYPELPHAVVLIGVVLLIIGLKLFLEQNNLWLMILANLFISDTHSIAALYSLLFIILFVFYALFAKLVPKRQLLLLGSVILILVIPVGLNLITPARSARQDVAADQAHGLHGSIIYERQLGAFYIPRIYLWQRDYYLKDSVIDIKALVVFACVTPYILALKRTNNLKLRAALVLLIMLSVLLVFNALYMATLTYVYLIRRSSQRNTKLLLSLLTIFYALFAYNPLALTLTHGLLPLWFIARLQDVNVISLVAPLLGACILFWWLARYGRVAKVANIYSMATLFFVVMLLPFSKFHLSFERISSDASYQHETAQQQQMLLRNLQRLTPYLKQQVILTNDEDTRKYVGTVASAPLGLLDNEQANQEQDYGRRQMCSTSLMRSLDLHNLQKAHITRLIFKTNNYSRSSDAQTITRAATTLGLTLLADEAGYKMYAVRTAPATFVDTGICAIPYKQ